MKEKYYDELLRIKTRGEQQGHPSILSYNRYEPTPYAALEKLFESYSLNRRDHVVDFGCGKGRLSFYIHYFFQAAVTGVEMSEVFYNEAMMNLADYAKYRNEKIHFYCCLAEEFNIQPGHNRFYFFNPFNVQIFRKVVNRILDSVEEYSRPADIILYYPSEDYLFYLEHETPFEWVQEIIVKAQDPFDRFIIYRLPQNSWE